jgi:hypothetical protein
MKARFAYLLALAVLTPAFADADNADVKLLRAGVKTIHKPGIPGPIAVFGEDAFAVVAGRSGKLNYAVVAAGRHGKGRFIAFGHGGYFGSTTHADTGKLFRNALPWLSPGKKSPLRIGERGAGNIAAYLGKSGHKVLKLRKRAWIKELSELDVLCLSPNNSLNKKQISAIHQFIKSGGGLVVSQLGWGWQQLNPNKSLAIDHPGNRLMRALGVVWGPGYLDVMIPDRGQVLRNCHARHALKQLAAADAGQLKLGKASLGRLAGTVSHTARSLPGDDPTFMAAISRVLAQRKASWPPSAKHPMKVGDALGRLALTVQHQQVTRSSAAAVKAFPSAPDFPGLVQKSVARISKTVFIRRDRGAWISTGLYANAGEVVSFNFPKAMLNARCYVRIGAHKDVLWGKDRWTRHPEISLRRPIKSQSMEICSPHGGLIYIEAPYKSGFKPDKVEIKNVVEAPYFVLGQTSAKQWQKIRQNPAPWAELETSKIILTVPSAEIRSLKDPVQLMSLWDKVLDCYEELGTRKLNRRPERMVTDRQISAGYMHSGYPIMTHLDAAARMVDSKSILGKPELKVWGLWHELGHNHQKRPWTFSGTTEVTCNLFTLYVLDRISGVSPEKHPRSPGMVKSAAKHIKAGAPFAQWKSQPFLALQMYVEIQQEFGWDLFKSVFAKYRDMPGNKQPRSDAQRRDMWLIQLSTTAGRDFGDFFAKWGVPVSKEARGQVKHLKVWTPKSWDYGR